MTNIVRKIRFYNTNLLQKCTVSAIACLLMYLVMKQMFCYDDYLTQLIEKNILNPTFAEREWFQVRGITTDIYSLKTEVKFNIPMESNCDETTCTMQLSEEVFTEENYKSWICRQFGLPSSCDILSVIKSWPNLKKAISSNGRFTPDVIQGLSPPLTCTSQRLADRVLRRGLGPNNRGSMALRDYSYTDKAELLFTCKLSPATLVQRLFPPMEGWLLERAIGSCGMITVHGASVVKTLYDLHHAPWPRRLDVAIQLLDLAFYFTENDSKFLLLFHRLTPHDFGISVTGKLRVQNTKNIIIVDSADDNQDYINKTYEASYDKNQFHIAEENICRYKRTDINYYMVCRHLLGASWVGLNGETLEGGLLHDPEELGVYISRMFVLLDLCTRGNEALPSASKPFNGSIRHLAAAHLRRILALRRPCSPEYQYRFPECEFEQPDTRLYPIPQFELKWLH